MTHWKLTKFVFFFSFKSPISKIWIEQKHNLFLTLDRNSGLFFNDDTEWLTQRRFALRNMRDFGFGRRHDKMESVVGHEVSVLVDILKTGASNDMEKVLFWWLIVN